MTEAPDSSGDHSTVESGTVRPSVLFVYYTYTQQTRKVLDVMAGVFRERGCSVEWAGLEFDDTRYNGRFATFPMPHPMREVLGMIPAELRRKPAKIGIPATVSSGDYDLVVIGSPTWWLSTNVPVRSFLESPAAGKLLNHRRFAVVVVCRRYWKHNLKTVRRLGVQRGGAVVDDVHFAYDGGQVRSLLSLLSYLGSGTYREKYLGVRIPPTNVREHHLDTARSFAVALVDDVLRRTATNGSAQINDAVPSTDRPAAGTAPAMTHGGFPDE